jgi:hypothetical protein
VGRRHRRFVLAGNIDGGPAESNNASYKKYRQAAKHTPVNSWNYAMRFTVNGKTYPILGDHK